MTLFGGMLFLAGCAGTPRRNTASLPGPAWPEDGGNFRNVIPPTPVPGPTIAAPDLLPAPVAGVIPRNQWTQAGVNPRARFPVIPLGRVNRITIHHDGMPPITLQNRSQVASRLEQIRQSHTRNGWIDIGYHFAIDPMGNVWECRSTRFQGAHVKDNNENNLGVLCLGNFEAQQPTLSQLSTLDGFVADRMRAYRLGVGRVFTHREITQTVCPGRHLQRYMLVTRGGRGNLSRA